MIQLVWQCLLQAVCAESLKAQLPPSEAVHEPQLCHMFCEVIQYLQWKWQLKASNSTDFNLK